MSDWREHCAELASAGASVDMPDDLRAQHQPDPQRISQGTQCVCACGAGCYEYVRHLQEVVDHRRWWDEAVRTHGHPLQHFLAAGIDPRGFIDV